MHYYNPENREPRIWAAVAVLVYLAVLVLLMLTLHFSIQQTEPADEGILVQFGQSESGMGDEDLAATDLAATPPTPQEESSEPLLTDENQDVEIEAAEQQEPLKAQQTQPQESLERRDTVAEQQVIIQQAMFPGRKDNSESTSKGSGEDVGNQGDVSGGDSGAAAGGGDDGVGSIAVLKDRRVVGSLPKPAYGENVSGRVIIDIVVDEFGYVTSASYRAEGSTTNRSQLIEAARQAALKARFTQSDNVVQGGTITYIFKLD